MSTEAGWTEIGQHRAHDRGGVRLRLAPAGRGAASAVHLTVPPDVAASLGWNARSRIGLQMGHGRYAGWLRFAPDPFGRTLRMVKHGTLVVALRAPEAWQGFTTPSLRCAEFRLQGDVLLACIPWDPDAMAEAADEETDA